MFKCILTCAEHCHFSGQFGLLCFSGSQGISNSYTACYAETQMELITKNTILTCCYTAYINRWSISHKNNLMHIQYLVEERSFHMREITVYATFASSYTTDWAPSSTSLIRPVKEKQQLDFRPTLLHTDVLKPQSDLWHYLPENLQSHTSTTQHTAWPCWGWPSVCMSPSPAGTL